MIAAVFLDRDGVLNHAFVRGGKAYSPSTIAEMTIVSDARLALNELRRHGLRLVLVTNQPDVARGKITRETVDAMNAHLASHVPLDAIEVCPHDDADRCDCRKPEPGMLLRAAERDGIALSKSFMVGDRNRDIEAGRRAGCRTILIGDGYGAHFETPPDVRVATLIEAVAWILDQSGTTARADGRR
jgi:D-glycero-D-manno-heptose 1,7-bisphosphate phosphatase